MFLLAIGGPFVPLTPSWVPTTMLLDFSDETARMPALCCDRAAGGNHFLCPAAQQPKGNTILLYNG